MQLAQSARYIDPRRFGRGPARVHAAALPVPSSVPNDEVTLFATTFAAGFLFVTVFLA